MSIYDCGMKNLTAEVVVVGGGPAGLTTAVALAGAGVETVLVAAARARKTIVRPRSLPVR